MCGRYVIFTGEENEEIMEIINEIDKRYKNDDPARMKMKTGEVFPTDTVPVIANETGSRVIKLFKWGFPNFKQSSGVIINARSETIEEKPTFRRVLNTGRCLVPANGFYEWKEDAGKKVKYLIRSEDKGLIYMAGLYGSFQDKNGLPYTGFVIITTGANESMSGIHNRMPAILDKPAASIWLDAGVRDMGLLKELLKPYQRNIAIERVG